MIFADGLEGGSVSEWSGWHPDLAPTINILEPVDGSILEERHGE